MEPKNFGYSMKNIPIPSNSRYKYKLIEMVESVIKRMRWKALFFLNNYNKGNNSENIPDAVANNTFKLKSRKCPPQIKEMIEFETDLSKMIENIKFRHTNSNFQKKLTQDLQKIKSMPEALMPADKTTNYYTVTKDDYNKLLLENITKTYKKANNNIPEKINSEAKTLAKNFGVEDRLNVMATQQCFITTKDHKEDFRVNPKYRLINPTKSELGKISKQIIQRINNQLRPILEVNQWQSTSSAINWFTKIPEKEDCAFAIFDIKDFYPSISMDLLIKSIDFACQHINISPKDKEIIFHARKSLLYDKEIPWVKRTGSPDFDVTMGSFDGAEVCELVGLYLLNQIGTKFNKKNVGLYRDDGLAVFKGLNGRQTDRARKDIIKIFKDNGLSLSEIKCDLKVVDYLDVTFDLRNGTYKPFKKPNNTPLYIHSESNHPPCITKQIPKGVSKRISNNSANEDIFSEAAPYYNEALRKCGYNEPLIYCPDVPTNETTRQRQRKCIWFNPPYSKNVKTNVGKTFLNLIDKHFKREHKLHKIFNRNTVKVSYGCMDSMGKFISSHNAQATQAPSTNIDIPCNCINKAACPLNGKCNIQNAAYLAKVNVPGDATKNKEYIGVSEPKCKVRIGNHKKSFNNRRYEKDSELSKYVWTLKDQGVDYSIGWFILKKTSGYNNKTHTCNLCLTEKLLISEHKDKDKLLNKRSELVSKCRHENKYLLKNFDPG